MDTTQTNMSEPQPGPSVTGAQALIESFLREGVDTIFGYPGGAIIPVYDALYDYRDRLRHILVRHEQGAVHAAQGYARVSGRVGVCLVTSGPGATNTVTGLADALMDSTPLVLVTGQVGSSLLGTDAFQETNFVGITQAVTKWNCQVKRTEEIPGAIAKAFYIARSGRPGPVVVDITKDAQCGTAPFSYEKVASIRSYVPASVPSEERIAEAARLIDATQRPLVMVGQGVILSGGEAELRAFLDKSGMPAASTLLGLSALPTDSPQYVGMLGMHGNYGPNIKNRDCDLLLAVGMRFDDRVTGRLSSFAPKATIVHIDIDPTSIHKNVNVRIPVVGDCRNSLVAIREHLAAREPLPWKERFAAWQGQLDEWKQEQPITWTPGETTIKPQEVIKAVDKITEGKAILTTEVGQHQMWAAQLYNFTEPRTLLTSGGLGTMGYGFPAAIGAQFAYPNKLVIDVSGDGSFQMNLQELITAVSNKLPVKVLLLNNGCLGMVRQLQDLFYGGRLNAVDIPDQPDFVKLAEAYGAEGYRVAKLEDLESTLRTAFASPNTAIIDVIVERDENVYPTVPSGASLDEMLLL